MLCCAHEHVPTGAHLLRKLALITLEALPAALWPDLRAVDLQEPSKVQLSGAETHAATATLSARVSF